MTIGVYDAKQSFNSLVARVECGEEVMITKHGKPVAKIVPVGESELTPEQAAQALMNFRFDGLGLTMPEVLDIIREGRQR